MLIERDLESAIIADVAKAAPDFEVVGSWAPCASGLVKGERRTDTKGIIAVAVSPRSHDAFTLPTVTVGGNLQIAVRLEQCPTMAEASEMYERVLALFDGWHYDADAFSSRFSTDSFFAAGLMLTGGDSVSFDEAEKSWIVSLGFQVRGTVKH